MKIFHYIHFKLFPFYRENAYSSAEVTEWTLKITQNLEGYCGGLWAQEIVKNVGNSSNSGN